MRSTFVALAAALALLAQHAQGTDANASRGRLKSADRAQCQTLLDGLNQTAHDHDSRLGELKTLEADIKALQSELDKETASVDRFDPAAMDALNERIQKNNRMIAQYEQLSGLRKELVADFKAREAQFRASCERTSAADLPHPAATSEASSCNVGTDSKGAAYSLESALAEVKADDKRRQDEVEQAAQARARERSWSKDKQSKVWLQILGMPKLWAIQREKQPFVQELMQIMTTKPRNEQEKCDQQRRIANTLPAIKAINARQYAFMMEQVRLAN